MNPILKAFARNRAEEIGEDLWADFIVPLYYDKLPFGEQRKPLVIVGGRGCGKTTLLRYLSHRTQFSSSRSFGDQVPTIGLYLKADTQFLRLFQGEELKPKGWEGAFGHFLALTLAAEVLESLNGLNCNEARRQVFGKLEGVRFAMIKAFSDELPTSVNELLNHLRGERLRFASWLNNAEDSPKPRFFPYREFLKTLIGELREQLDYLRETDFFVFIDEYENLLEYQQEIINTAIKHSEPPLIFNIAMKRNGMKTRKTVGSEAIQHIADYREVDIEDLLQKHNYDLFAAELFFFRLDQQGIGKNQWPISREQLRMPDRVGERRDDPGYAERVLSQVHRVLPGLDWPGLAHAILSEPSLRARLVEWITQGLRRSTTEMKADEFLRDDAPLASIICGALLHQEHKRPEMIHAELLKRAAGSESDFEGWEHTYFLGSVLYVYVALQRACPVYSGFKAFVLLSQPNTRHFLELCHSAVIDSKFSGSIVDFSIPIDVQARAARHASSLFLDEIPGAGDHGNRLHTMVATLGQIFQLSQQRPSQSEAERTHFSLPSEALSASEQLILDEAVKWSVLFEHEETKVKNARFQSYEYVLNPIYAPHFGISYRKGRKLEMQEAQGHFLLKGNQTQLSSLIQGYRRSWFRDSGAQLALIGDDE